MSGLNEWPVVAFVVLHCDARGCEARWESEEYDTASAYYSQRIVSRAQPAFDFGWRIFAGARTQHTYCPLHGPKSPMKQIHPRAP